MRYLSSGLLGGMLGGATLALIALGFGSGVNALLPDARLVNGMAGWLTANLGNAVWLFLGVLGAYAIHLGRLRDLLGQTPQSRDVAQLDQLTDVWIHVFIGIGVVWTAIGMRAALQAALGNPTEVMTDSASDVLQRLVDGGILLALSTTIVGAIGGYLMRLGKSLYLGPALQAFYEAESRSDSRALLAAIDRLEAYLESPAHAERSRQTAPAAPTDIP